jgi:hypothetical protein
MSFPLVAKSHAEWPVTLFVTRTEGKALRSSGERQEFLDSTEMSDCAFVCPLCYEFAVDHLTGHDH